MGLNEALLDLYKKEGIKEGIKEGKKKGEEIAYTNSVKIISLLKEGKTVLEIAKEINIEKAFVQKIKDQLD